MNRILLALMMAVSVPMLALAQGDYWFYDRDGTEIELDVYDSLVAVRIDPAAGGFAHQTLAYEHESLEDDFDFEFLPGGFYLFGIEPGYSLEQVMLELRLEEEVFMVNPVIRNEYGKESFLGNRLLVHFNEGTTRSQIDSLNISYGFTLTDSLGTDHVLYLFDYEQETWSDITALACAYYESGFCYVVEPSRMSTLEALGDPYYGEQWHLRNTGQEDGTPGADIDWELGQQWATDDMLTVVAVLDLGFEQEHEDLEDYWYYWPYDAVGSNIYNQIPDTEPWIECDGVSIHCWHGIAVMGMIKATTNNSLGVAGVDSDVRIMPVKIGDDQGRYRSETVLYGLLWASGNHGGIKMDICNISLGVDFSPAMEARLQWMYEGGLPVVCAAGNYGVVAYPASSPYTLAIGMTDRNDDWVPGSGVGPQIDLVAPGHDLIGLDLMNEAGLNPAIYQCNGDPNYACHLSGTSFAAPIVAGMAAKLLGIRRELFDPWHTTISVDLMYEVLRKSAERTQYGAAPNSEERVDNFVGWGRVNVDRAAMAVMRGDADQNSVVNISDVVTIIAYIFGGGEIPDRTWILSDCDCNGLMNISDAVYLIAYMFGGGPAPKVCFKYDY